MYTLQIQYVSGKFWKFHNDTKFQSFLFLIPQTVFVSKHLSFYVLSEDKIIDTNLFD